VSGAANVLGVTTLPWHPSNGPRPAEDDGYDQPSSGVVAPTRPIRFAWQRADCCVAPAAYRVVFAAAQTGERPAELLLCGHHYRSSRDALARREASVYDANGRPV
jgi:hypothetical protein